MADSMVVLTVLIKVVSRAKMKVAMLAVLKVEWMVGEMVVLLGDLQVVCWFV
jgi:hypothetical protein